MCELGRIFKEAVFNSDLIAIGAGGMIEGIVSKMS